MVAAASVRAAQQATVVRAASASVAPQSCRTQARCYSEEAPVPGDAAPVSPKIQGLVDEIAKLTLLEVADLCATLKVRYLLLQFFLCFSFFFKKRRKKVATYIYIVYQRVSLTHCHLCATLRHASPPPPPQSPT